MNEFFALTEQDGIAHLQLRRPERLNTLAPPFFPALRDAVRALDDAGATRVLLISSTGRHFCAGMSLDVFGAYPEYFRRSRAEFTVAKDQNVRLRSGWFSERDDCRS